MNPLSPLYFIKQNKKRCLLLMFMIFLSFGAYLGGLYIYTPQENWDYPCSVDDKLIAFYQSDNEKIDKENYENFCEEIQKRGVTVIELGWYNEIIRKTVMGFTDGSLCYTFRSVDDFKLYCEYYDIEVDFTNVKPKTVILSKLMADLAGYEVGSVISESKENSVCYDFTVSALTEEPSYTQYFIGTEEETPNDGILFSDKMSIEEVRKHVDEVAEMYPVEISSPLWMDVDATYSIFNTIFFVVVVFLALILSVTVNAAFVGMYQRREFEFAVYRAIGISKKKLIRKIAGEILLMDIIVLVLGSGIFFFGLYLFNEVALEPKGLYLVYTAPIAVLALVLCNVATVVPLIITRSKVLMKADICNY